MARCLELVGGPWDGQQIALQDGARELRIVLASRCELFGPADPSATEPGFREGRYVVGLWRKKYRDKRHGECIIDTDALIWEGEG